MPISDKRKQSMYAYAKANLKRIPFNVQKEFYEKLKAAADTAGESVNGYIKKSVALRMAAEEQNVNTIAGNTNEDE